MIVLQNGARRWSAGVCLGLLCVWLLLVPGAGLVKRTEQPDKTCDISHLFKDNDHGAICSYIRDSCDTTVFKLAQDYYCTDSVRAKTALIAAFGLSVVLIFLSFGILTSDFLYCNLDTLSKIFNISRRISGLTLLALGNATPDIFSTYSAMSTDSSSLAIGELLGSANFVICFIIGAMGLIRPFQVNHYEFIKDLYFFLVLISTAIYFMYDGKLTNSECIAMIVLYCAYVLYSIFFTNEGKDPKEFDFGVPMDEEARPGLTPRSSNRTFTVSPLLTPEQQLEFAALESTLDENKLRGLQKLSYFDSMNVIKVTRQERSHSQEHLAAPEQLPIIRKNKSADQIPLSQPSPTRLLSPPTILLSDESDQTDQVLEPQIPSTANPEPTRVQSTANPEPTRVQSTANPEPTRVQSTANPEPTGGSFFTTAVNYLISRDIITAEIKPIPAIPLMLFFLIIPHFPSKYYHTGQDESEPVKDEKLIISFKRKLFAFQIIVSTFTLKYLMIQDMSVLLPILLSASLIATIFYFRNSYKFLLPISGFISSIQLILLISSFLINLLKNFGVILHISESLLGLTILALGNSMGDLVSNLTLASLDLSVIGINACFGSPLLYTLIGVGVNGLIINLRNHQSSFTLNIDTSFKLSSAGLISILIFYAVAIPINGWYIDKKIGGAGILWWIFITTINIYFR